MASSLRAATARLLLGAPGAAEAFPQMLVRAPYLAGSIRAAALGLDLPADPTGKGLGLLAPFLSSDPAACAMNSFPRVPLEAADLSSSAPTMTSALRAGAAKIVRQASVSGQGLATMGSLSRDVLFSSSSARNGAVKLFFASPALVSVYPEIGTYFEELVVNACYRFSPYQGAGTKEYSPRLPLAASDVSVSIFPRFPIADALAEGLRKLASSSYLSSSIYQSAPPQMSSMFKVMAVGICMGSCVLAEGYNSSDESEERDFEKEIEDLKTRLRSAEDSERIWRKTVEDGKKEKKEVETMGKRLIEIGGGGGHEPWWRKLLNFIKNPYAQFAITLATFPLLATNFINVCVESSTGWVYMVLVGYAYSSAPLAKLMEAYDGFKEEWLARLAQRQGEVVPGRCICGKEVPVKHRCQFCGKELPHVHCGPGCRVVRGPVD